MHTVVDAREHREHERGRLAGAGLRLADHVARRVLQQQRERALLDLAWLGKLHRIDSLEQVLVQAELLERLGREQRRVRVRLLVGERDLHVILGLVEARLLTVRRVVRPVELLAFRLAQDPAQARRERLYF